MFKFIAIVVLAFVALVAAEPKPLVATYAASPLAYSAYSAPLTYSSSYVATSPYVAASPYVASAYSAYPYAAAAYIR